MRDNQLCARYTVQNRVSLLLRGIEHTLFTMFSHCDCGPLRTRLLHVGIDLGHNIRRDCSNLSFGNGFVKKSLIFHFPLICRMKNCDFWILSRNQKNRTSMLFDRLALMVSVASPSATFNSTSMLPSSLPLIKEEGRGACQQRRALAQMQRHNSD